MSRNLQSIHEVSGSIPLHSNAFFLAGAAVTAASDGQACAGWVHPLTHHPQIGALARLCTLTQVHQLPHTRSRLSCSRPPAPAAALRISAADTRREQASPSVRVRAHISSPTSPPALPCCASAPWRPVTTQSRRPPRCILTGRIVLCERCAIWAQTRDVTQRRGASPRQCRVSCWRRSYCWQSCLTRRQAASVRHHSGFGHRTAPRVARVPAPSPYGTKAPLAQEATLQCAHATLTTSTRTHAQVGGSPSHLTPATSQ